MEGLLKVAECPQAEGYIKRVSTNGLCMMPPAVGGSASPYSPDDFYTNGATQTGLRVRAAGGCAYYGTNAGACTALANCTATHAAAIYSSPLCVFVDDPTVEA